jgi:hypothetical protein
MQLHSGVAQLIHGFDGYDAVPHRCERSRVGPDARSNVENARWVGWYEMQDGPVMFGKRNAPPLLD